MFRAFPIEHHWTIGSSSCFFAPETVLQSEFHGPHILQDLKARRSRIRWTYGPDEGYLPENEPISLQTGFSRKIINSNILEGWGYVIPRRVKIPQISNHSLELAAELIVSGRVSLILSVNHGFINTGVIHWSMISCHQKVVHLSLLPLGQHPMTGRSSLEIMFNY